MKIFGNLKKQKKENKSYIELESLVVGEDIHTLCYIFNRREKLENSKFIISKRIDFEETFGKGYEKIRGKQNIDFCKKGPMGPFLSEATISPTFFKDNQFRLFGGRSKSETLQKEEVFFTQKSINFEFGNGFSFLRDSSFWDFFYKESHVSQINKVELKEKDGDWIIELLNGTTFRSKNLIWGLPPWKLLSFFGNKSELNNGFIEFCENTRGAFSLKVLFKLKEKISEMKETFFIPLSLTHEWGHFLGNFYELGDEYFLELNHYFNPEKLSEEEISKRIKILKRSLEKVFPSFSKSLDNEYLSINENVSQVVGNPLLKEKNKMRGLTFIGENAPLPIFDGNEETQQVSHFVRGIISSGFSANLTNECS